MARGPRDEVDAADLVSFLALVEEHLDDPITLVGAGGTGLTLLGAKPSTIDIDFTGPSSSITAFRMASDEEPHGYDIDAWPDGTVFMATLPEDYLERSREAETSLRRIELRALHPVDLVVTKVARYDRRDREDIQRAVEMFGLEPEDVRRRAEGIEYVGSQQAYEANLSAALQECFGNDR